MEFCERDYTQMRITPFAMRLTWPRGTEGRPRVGPFRSHPRRYASAYVSVRCVLRVSNFASSAMRGKEEGRWTENCFMLRF